MLPAVLERLTYALLGLVFGLLLGVLSWFALYHLQVDIQVGMFGWGRRGAGFDLDFVPWVRNVGVLFAVLGFVLKERTGTWLGNAFTVWFDFERENWSWLMLGVVTLLSVIWYLYA
jgi:hypothetical protein